MTVHFACHYIQARRELARQAKLSHAVVYLDISNAFYSAQRGAIFPDLLGMPDELVDDTVRLSTLGQPSAPEELGAPQSLQKWIQTVMTGSWRQVKTSVHHEHAHEAMVSLRGTRPRDPVADLALTTLMYQVLQRSGSPRRSPDWAWGPHPSPGAAGGMGG